MILIISSKNCYSSKRLEQEALFKGLEIEILEASEIQDIILKDDFSKYTALYVRSPYVNGDPKYIPFVVELAKKFKELNKKVVDEVIALGGLGLGKMVDYETLEKFNLPIPKTTKINGRQKMLFPYVLKWVFGLGGKNVFLIRSQKNYDEKVFTHPLNEWMQQEFISADFEYKVAVIGYKALSTVLKIPFNVKIARPDFTKSESVQGAQELLKIAEQACRVLGREISKVDILEKNGNFYILEVNRYPGFKGFEEATNLNIYRKILEYLL